MMKLFDIIAKYGIETAKYPLEPYEVARDFRGKPEYNHTLCIGCSACAVACPPNAISVKANDGYLVWDFNLARCIYCARCEEVCPTNAICLTNEFETAAKFDKNALKQSGKLKMAICKECNKAYSSQRLIEYTLKRLENSNLSEERLKSARFYVHLCPDCKSKRAISSPLKEIL